MQSTNGAIGHVTDWDVTKEVEPIPFPPINFTFVLH